MSEAPWRVPLVYAATSMSVDPDLDRLLLDASVDEVSRGWVRGPLSRATLDEEYGPGNWLAGKKFGLHQSSGGKAKFRVIDDFSIHGHNRATSPSEVLDHGGLDEIISLLRTIGGALLSGSFSFSDDQDKLWSGVLASGWKGQQLKARTLDLKSAYKQLAVHPADLPLALTAAFHPDLNEPRCWQSLALPFGATASVYAFNACSRAIERIMMQLGGITCTSYFDDFSFIEPEAATSSSTTTSESTLRLLG